MQETLEWLRTVDPLFAFAFAAFGVLLAGLSLLFAWYQWHDHRRKRPRREAYVEVYKLVAPISTAFQVPFEFLWEAQGRDDYAANVVKEHQMTRLKVLGYKPFLDEQDYELVMMLLNDVSELATTVSDGPLSSDGDARAKHIWAIVKRAAEARHQLLGRAEAIIHGTLSIV